MFLIINRQYLLSIFGQLMVIFLLIRSFQALPQSCTFILSPPELNNTLYINPTVLPGVKPGDVICLEAGSYYRISVSNLNGLPDQPIILKNIYGRVVVENDSFYGISIKNTSCFRVEGNGCDSIVYGIAILKVTGGAGLSFDQLSSSVSASYIEIANTALSGIIAKTDPNCSFLSTRDKFTMYNTVIHNNYLHDIGMEGLYLGNSFFNGFMIHCNGADTLVYPHLMNGLQVFDNLIERTGRNGIQVGSANLNCRIFNNKIFFDSQNETVNQMGGIQIGGGSSCDCYNNFIASGKGSGIEIFGIGNMLIFNNVIESPGKLYKPEFPHYQYPKHGIYIKDVSTMPGAFIHLFNNTIINPKSDGISFNNPFLSASRIQNNIIINPGAYNEIGSMAYVHHTNPDLTISHNLFSTNILQARFNDPAISGYSLRQSSPAFDQGTDMSQFGISFDHEYAPRPMGKAYDIGAYELNPEIIPAEPSVLSIYPNPSIHDLKVKVCLPEGGDATLEIFNPSGVMIYNHFFLGLPAGREETLQIGFHFSSAGIYILSLKSMNESVITKLVRLQ